MSNNNCRDAKIVVSGSTVTVSWKGDCTAAAYSYADTGIAQWDPSKDQTFLKSIDQPSSFELVGCDVDFQIDIFKGEVIIKNIPQNLYGDRLKTATHVDGIPCATTTSTTPSTTSTSTTVSTVPSTTSTTVEEPTTTTSSTTPASTTSSTTPASTTSSSFTPITYTCDDPWIGANRDIDADHFVEPWEVALDPDGNGVICETPAVAASSTLVSVPDPTTSTSLLPFTGGHEATFLQIGAPLLIAGVLLTTWSKLRLRAVPVR